MTTKREDGKSEIASETATKWYEMTRIIVLLTLAIILVSGLKHWVGHWIGQSSKNLDIHKDQWNMNFTAYLQYIYSIFTV